jgi:hypothetical protein
VNKEPAAASPATARRTRIAVLAIAWSAAVLAALTVALGVSRLFGEAAREGALVLAEAPIPGDGLTFSDAPDAGRFFDARDTVTVTVPWPMTAAEFLSVYHLENNADARRALREQLGAESDAHPLAAGAAVTFHLTVRSAR